VATPTKTSTPAVKTATASSQFTKVPAVPTPSPTVATKQDTMTIASLEAKWSIAAAVIKQDPSLLEVLYKILGTDAAGNKISGQITDPVLQQQLLMNTDWFKKNTDDYRKFQYYKETNPATFNADLAENAKTIAQKYFENGIKIEPSVAINLAEQAMMKSAIVNGKAVNYDTSWLNRSMADAIDFTKTKTIGGVKVYDMQGNIANIANSLYQTANDYGFKASLSDKNFTDWFQSNVKGLVSGDILPDQVANELHSRAISMFPGLAPQIQQGKTLRDAADPWLQAIASTWEVDANSLDLNNDFVQRVLNNQDEKGNVAPMNLYEAKKTARRSPQFDYTSTAKEEKTGIASKILKDFGFLG